MKLSVFFLLFIFFIQDNSNRIEWNSHIKLKFEDFQAISDTADFDGISSIDVEHSFYFDSNIVHYSIICYFYKSYSWLKINDSNLLSHEQGHFDIGEIYARRIRKYFHFLKSTNYEETNKEITKIRNEDALDSVYDEETEHGANLETQQVWNNRIAHMLDSLKDYSAPEDSCLLKQ